MKIPTWVWIIGGIALIAALSTGGTIAVNYISAAWMASDNAQKWAPFLSSIEDAYGLPNGLLSNIAYQESRFKQDVIDGTTPSPAGALGMMQLMPQFFTSVQVPTPFTDTDTQNQIREAANFLVTLFNHFGDWTTAVAGYNAGQGAIDKVLAGTQPLSAETADYIAKVSSRQPDLVNPTLSA